MVPVSALIVSGGADDAGLALMDSTDDDDGFDVVAMNKSELLLWRTLHNWRLENNIAKCLVGQLKPKVLILLGGGGLVFLILGNRAGALHPLPLWQCQH